MPLGVFFFLQPDLFLFRCGTLNNGKQRASRRLVSNPNGFQFNEIKRDVIRRNLVQPIDSLCVFFGQFFTNPNSNIGAKICEISNELAEMIVIGLFQLVFNNYLISEVVLAV